MTFFINGETNKIDEKLNKINAQIDALYGEAHDLEKQKESLILKSFYKCDCENMVPLEDFKVIELHVWDRVDDKFNTSIEYYCPCGKKIQRDGDNKIFNIIYRYNKNLSKIKSKTI